MAEAIISLMRADAAPGSALASGRECGQAVDERDLGEVLHYEEPGHEPTPVS
jgi:hypothetical protein